MRTLLVVSSLLLLVVGCGGVVQSECTATGKQTATLRVDVAPAYATADVIFRGDCSTFSCARQANGGCTLWQGTISTAPGSVCNVTLSQKGETVETARIEGATACGKASTRVVLGDEPR